MLAQHQSIASIFVTILILFFMFGGFLISTYKLRFLEAFKASFSTMWKGGRNLTNERINEYQDLSQVKDQQQLLLQVGRDSDSIEE